MMEHLRAFFKTQPAYDARPWFCMALGLYALFMLHASWVGESCGVVLVGAASIMFYMRNSARFDVRRGVEVRVKR